MPKPTGAPALAVVSADIPAAQHEPTIKTSGSRGTIPSGLEADNLIWRAS